jgi:hypothetical protein
MRTVGASVRSCRAMPAAICKQIRAQVKLGVERIGFTAVVCLLTLVRVLWSKYALPCLRLYLGWHSGAAGMWGSCSRFNRQPCEIYVQLGPI